MHSSAETPLNKASKINKSKSLPLISSFIYPILLNCEAFLLSNPPPACTRYKKIVNKKGKKVCIYRTLSKLRKKHRRIGYCMFYCSLKRTIFVSVVV